MSIHITIALSWLKLVKDFVKDIWFRCNMHLCGVQFFNNIEKGYKLPRCYASSIGIAITNYGKKSLPPHVIHLKNVSTGHVFEIWNNSLFVWSLKSHDTEQLFLVDEIIRHNTFERKQVNHQIHFNSEQFDEWEFQLISKDNRKILFKSKHVGQQLINLIRDYKGKSKIQSLPIDEKGDSYIVSIYPNRFPNYRNEVDLNTPIIKKELEMVETLINTHKIDCCINHWYKKFGKLKL